MVYAIGPKVRAHFECGACHVINDDIEPSLESEPDYYGGYIAHIEAKCASCGEFNEVL